MALNRAAIFPLAALALAVAVSAQGPQAPQFVAQRLRFVELPPLPPPTVTGGGEVLIEATVDRSGTLSRPIIVRGTPPYTQLVLDAMRTWRFAPARVVAPDGVETAVDMQVAIGAAYRPPILMNAPTVGETPRDWSKPSGDAAYPIATAMPNYPPQARDGGVVLFELVLNEAGAVTETRGMASTAGFEDTSREALASWRFKGGMYRARPVPSTVYVLFGFRPPVGLPQLPVKDPGKDPYKPNFPPPPPPVTEKDPYKPNFPPPPPPVSEKDPYKPNFPPPPAPKSDAAPPLRSFGILSFR
jgi:hypothetical protein